MTMQLAAIVKGISYSLSDGTYANWISTTGVGLPAISRITEQGVAQHGRTDRGYSIDQRSLFLPLLLRSSTLAGVDTMRDNLSMILSPFTDAAIKLRVTRDDGTVRQIDCFTHEMIDMPHTPTQDRIGTSQMVVVQLAAADPFWYDPTIYHATLRTDERGVDVEVDVPLLLDTSGALETATTIQYLGTAPDYPTIYITGPVTDLTITNDTTGDVLDWTGTTIAAGTTRTVTLAYGAKTIVDANGANKIAELDETNSDLTSWHLEPRPAAVNGDNDISVTGSSATDATEIRIEYYRRYLQM